MLFLGIYEGDVLSGTSASGTHHAGVLEGWFGDHWWNGRFFILLITTLCVFAPLACFKRIGELLLDLLYCLVQQYLYIYCSTLQLALWKMLLLFHRIIAVIKSDKA